MSLADLTAADAARRIAVGEIRSIDLVGACLERIDEIDENIQAWTYLNRDHALDQARRADEARQTGASVGPLHGIPIGVKDIFDTADMPTEDGSVLHAGRQPNDDCTAVALLRQAGAVIMGKTVTTEFATYAPGKTRNPHDPERTPGGSSSGSAAAVATGMVPLAIGTQTNGSVIRPAAFCGTFGYKPSHGLISRHGVLQLSRNLDHVGVFARSVEDAALIGQELMAYDPGDPDTRPRARPALVDTASDAPPVAPRLAFVRSPVWGQADDDAKEAFAELVEHLGDGVEEVGLPEAFGQAHEWHRIIMAVDVARNLAREYQDGRDRLSDTLRGIIENGQKCLAVDYCVAVESARALPHMLNEFFEDFDAILTPATTGQAPVGLESTGSPMFCTIWTLCGMPAVSVPVLRGENGMPIGVQLVGPKGDDARLLRTARWLAEAVAEA
jgi:Asp-tRNA(Asn)/Glu-tRNA(Gln) amidotransferase A subunit family amidase